MNEIYSISATRVRLINLPIIFSFQVRDQTVLDREKRSTISMRVYAKEKVPSVVTSQLGTSSVNIEVTLLDANDNNPTFIPNNLYEFVITTKAKKGKYLKV